MRDDERIVGVRVSRGSAGPAVVVRCRPNVRQGDVVLPQTFHGLPVEAEVGLPLVLATAP
jgi:hypothetical protein